MFYEESSMFENFVIEIAKSGLISLVGLSDQNASLFYNQQASVKTMKLVN